MRHSLPATAYPEPVVQVRQNEPPLPTEAAPSDRLALQIEATQARVDRSSLDGTLADSSIVLFATHALLGGELDGMVGEPALALTPGTGSANQPGEANDGLLTASEVAQLRFNAALVILSACDTAAGAGDGDGFSGLTRAFLLARARAVLATYSPVVDEVGERMTTATVANLKVCPHRLLILGNAIAHPEWQRHEPDLAVPLSRPWVINFGN
jgi:CHAT domain-containing protein